jgi:hypothetical protein
LVDGWLELGGWIYRGMDGYKDGWIDIKMVLGRRMDI